MNFAARLTAARKSRGLTQQTLADTVGIHVTQIRRYEAGTNQPTLDVLRALALALNVTTDTSSSTKTNAAPPTTPCACTKPSTSSPRRTRARRARFIEGALLRHQARRLSAS